MKNNEVRTKFETAADYRIISQYKSHIQCHSNVADIWLYITASNVHFSRWAVLPLSQVRTDLLPTPRKRLSKTFVPGRIERI